MSDEQDKPLTLDAAAARLKVQRRTIRDYIAAGLPTYTIGGIRYVRESELYAEYRRRKKNQRATRITSHTENPR